MSLRPTGDNGSPFWQPPDDDELDEDRKTVVVIIGVVFVLIGVSIIDWLMRLI